MNDQIKKLEKNAKDFGINLTSCQLKLFEDFFMILKEYNQQMNLVSNTEEKVVFEKHFIDSLALAKVQKTDKLKLIDVGTGGGFPAIPLAIAFPEWEIVAVDSVGKKINFINMTAEKLGLSGNLKAINVRSEELARNEDFREKFDICTTRAVAQMPVIAEYCLPFLKKDGLFIAYKAKTAEEELKNAQKAIKILGGKELPIISYEISENEEDRNLIVIKKISKTPAKYPRKTGIAKKTPLV
ncbi:MAG: 16S rRNA (guanine(527)-N(7))-methyltransferase RsmG [Candidatus Gastranaerophilales bacterium]|nr:16S rRNA (guanine(527)-N(7))-methyltransferase RsmG [Candidatus Gastranaerophilales bacterium]